MVSNISRRGKADCPRVCAGSTNTVFSFRHGVVRTDELDDNGTALKLRARTGSKRVDRTAMLKQFKLFQTRWREAKREKEIVHAEDLVILGLTPKGCGRNSGECRYEEAYYRDVRSTVRQRSEWEE